MNKGGSIQSLETHRDALNVVFQEHGVILAYLYGSQARSDAGPLSDVDIAVLFAREMNEDERFHHLLELHVDLARVFERDDVFIFDLEKGTPLLNNNVRVDGVILYCDDDEARIDFEIRAFQQYVDTIPLRHEFNFYLGQRIRSGLFGRAVPIVAAVEVS